MVGDVLQRHAVGGFGDEGQHVGAAEDARGPRGECELEAVVDATFDPDTIQFLDSVVRESQYPLDLVEIRFLRQIAARVTGRARLTLDPGDTITVGERFF